MLIVLFEPEIPPNTGNIARLCAAFGVELHLVEPLGFLLDDKHLKRAGLDYWPNVRLYVWKDWTAFCTRKNRPMDERHILCTTKGKKLLQDFQFSCFDALVLGPETRGLPMALLDHSPWTVRIPILGMDEGGARSLNLSTAAGIFLYAALASCAMLPA